ncbi:ribokinase [Emticicia sp. SJ17W-69]|uniref:ribokinase n=1 Tax=Emticicia sp. SJ17W-69 TaxID=3421657 RepID=UPI003EC0C952
MKQKIFVIGSSNTDMVVKSQKLPAPGETIIGGTFLMNPGGKGANQAVAAAKLGANVTFVSKTGNDIFGKQAIQGFQREGINTDFVFTDLENPSGVALILVDAKGENSIAVASGANGNLQISEVEKAIGQIMPNDTVLFQLEIPIPTVEFAIKKSFERGAKVILNPAPAQVLDESVFKYLDIITPNETEAELLTGIKVIDLNTAEQAALKLHEKGVKNVIITLGSRGAYLHNDTINHLIPAPVVEATDTTAAGDVFNGALAVALSEGQDLEQAISFACRAAAISVTRMGAQASAPKRSEITSMSE